MGGHSLESSGLPLVHRSEIYLPHCFRQVDDCAHSSGSGHGLSEIFEVDRLETCSNVALAGTATSSSTAYSGEPSRAIDGGFAGEFGANSCTHTENTDSWWQVGR